MMDSFFLSEHNTTKHPIQRLLHAVTTSSVGLSVLAPFLVVYKDASVGK